MIPGLRDPFKAEKHLYDPIAPRPFARFLDERTG